MDGGAEDSGVYKPVTGLSRGLAVLQALVVAPNGRASPAELATRTGIHRTTVRRLLETLRREGFVQRNDNDGSFVVTVKIREIAGNVTDAEWISGVASPILRGLSSQVVWPCDLAIPDGTAMLIRDSTHHFSPLSFHRGMIGTRLPMLRTAMGRAYLAFSREEVRAAILRQIAQDPHPEARFTGSPYPIEKIIRLTREQGFGMNYEEWRPKTGAVSVPLLSKNGEVVACINIIVNTIVVSFEQLLSDFVPPLRLAAKAVDRLLQDH